MVKEVFLEKDVECLFEERFIHPHPLIHKRLEALYLKSQGMKHDQICRLLRISGASISNWLRAYKDGGIEGVKTLNYRKKWGNLTSHQKTLEDHFRKNPPRTVQEAIRVIFVWQGLLEFLWCFARVWFGSPSRRQRFNVLGALNALTYEVVTVCNSSYINSESVTDLLFKLRKRFLKTETPISIILDNAAY